MPILLKILGESHQGMSHRDMGGISGINYRFDWEPKHGAFTYEAQTQEQIDDIIQVKCPPVVCLLKLLEDHAASVCASGSLRV